MKSILYFIIAIIIFGGSFLGISKAVRTTNVITIQSTDRNQSPDKLSQSVYIISQRLKAFYSEKFDIRVIPEKYQIQVTLLENKDWETIGKLITEKGSLEFYETYSLKSIRGLLHENKEIMEILQNSDPNDSSSRIGCLGKDQLVDFEGKVFQKQLYPNLKFAWNNFFDTAQVCLYALKLDSGNKPVLTGSDIENFQLEHNDTWNKDVLNLKFRIPVIPRWAELTRNNQNKNIAMVLDKKLICAPTVRTEIKGGFCQITGDFNHREMCYIATILQYGELPLNFEVLR